MNGWSSRRVAYGGIWFVGEWDDPGDARVALVVFAIAIRRGLSVSDAIELAREVAAEEGAIGLADREGEIAYGSGLPAGWEADFRPGPSGAWALYVWMKPDINPS